MKTMKNLKMSLEPLQILSLLYQYYLFIKDQQPVHKDQQPDRKDQLQVLILVMKTVREAMSTVHRVRTLEEQYPIQISTFEPMTNIGQWRLKHNYAAAAGPFCFATTENGDQQDMQFDHFALFTTIIVPQWADQ